MILQESEVISPVRIFLPQYSARTDGGTAPRSHMSPDQPKLSEFHQRKSIRRSVCVGGTERGNVDMVMINI